MDFGPAVYRGSWAGLGRGSWLHSGGGGGAAVGSWIRGFVGAVRGFVDPWGVRGFVGGSWEVRGFVGSWVSGWVRGFVDSFARFRVRGVSFVTNTNIFLRQPKMVLVKNRVYRMHFGYKKSFFKS